MGTPVEIKLSGIKMQEKNIHKLVAFGGESGEVRVYEYNTDLPRAATGERRNRRSSVGSAITPVDNAADAIGSAETQDHVVSSDDSGECAVLLFGYQIRDAVNSVSLSGNAERVALSDAAGCVKVLEIGGITSKSKEDEVIFTHQNVGNDNRMHAIWDIALSHSGQRLITCGSGKTVRCFDVGSGAELYRRLSNDRMSCVAMSADGENIASGAEDGKINCCSLTGGARCLSFEQLSNVQAVDTDHSGSRLVVGCESGRISVLNTNLASDPTRAALATSWQAHHRSKISAVAISHDGVVVAAGDCSGVVRLYHAADGKIIFTRTHWRTGASALGENHVTSSLAFSGDGGILVIGRHDNYAYVLDKETQQEIIVLQRHDDIFSVGTAHSQSLVAVGGRDKFAVVYELIRTPSRRQAKSRTVCSVVLDAFVASVSLSSDGRLLAVGAVDESVNLYTVAGQEFLHKLQHNGNIYSTAFSTNTRHLAVGTDEHFVTVWELGDHDSHAPKRVLLLPRYVTLVVVVVVLIVA